MRVVDESLPPHRRPRFLKVHAHQNHAAMSRGEHRVVCEVSTSGASLYAFLYFVVRHEYVREHVSGLGTGDSAAKIVYVTRRGVQNHHHTLDR